MRSRTARPLFLLSGVVVKGRSEVKGGGTIVGGGAGQDRGHLLCPLTLRRGEKERAIEARIHQASWTIMGGVK